MRPKDLFPKRNVKSAETEESEENDDEILPDPTEFVDQLPTEIDLTDATLNQKSEDGWSEPIVEEKEEMEE